MNRFERRTERLLDAVYTAWASIMKMFDREDRTGREVFTEYLRVNGLELARCRRFSLQ